MSGERWHGTIGGYTNHSCRCVDCRTVWADYHLRATDRRAAMIFDGTERWHGTLNGYTNYRCSCEECRAAFRLYQAARRAVS